MTKLLSGETLVQHLKSPKTGVILETITYTVLVQIGKGSFATCWKCHNTKSGELVAIKVIDKSKVKTGTKLETQL